MGKQNELVCEKYLPRRDKALLHGGHDYFPLNPTKENLRQRD